MTADAGAGVRRRRVVLASASPARAATLRAAGVEPAIMASGVDESEVAASLPADVVLELAGRKARTVAATLRDADLVIGCDSLLELGGVVHGKPAGAVEAVAQWKAMRDRAGVLHTGHCVVDLATNRSVAATASTTVHFADVSDAEIEAYVATGEPLHVAGAFTIDGLGGAFVDRIEGDPHTVVGISLPLLRRLLLDLGISWTDLWTAA